MPSPGETGVAGMLRFTDTYVTPITMDSVSNVQPSFYQQELKAHCDAEYLVFVSSRSLKAREKYTN